MTGLRLAVVLLAAGMGKRFGGDKLTAPYKNGLLIDGALAAARAAPVETILVVTGSDPKVIEVAEALGDPRITTVYAEDHKSGLAASLKAGIAALPPGLHGAYILLGDMPRVPHGIFEPLKEAIQNGAPAAAPVFGGTRGHPVLVASGLFSELMRLQGDNGAGGVLNALGPQVRTIPSGDDGVLFDVDIRGGLNADGLS